MPIAHLRCRRAHGSQEQEGRIVRQLANGREESQREVALWQSGKTRTTRAAAARVQNRTRRVDVKGRPQVEDRLARERAPTGRVRPAPGRRRARVLDNTSLNNLQR